MFSDSMILDQINRGRIKIEGGPSPWVEDGITQEVTPSDVIQPASYELTLAEGYIWGEVLGRPGFYFASDFPTWLRPGWFLLASTQECVTLDSQVAARLEGKSSLARKGLVVHSTAGFIDPGFSGQITLEMSNVGPWPILLEPGMRIGQLTFEACIGKVLRPYGTESLGSHYQHQTGATPPV